MFSSGRYLLPFQALAGLVELPAIGFAMFIIMKVGKKWFFCSTIFLAGVACACISFIEGSPSLQWLKITLLMLGECESNEKWPTNLTDLKPKIAGKFTISAGNTIMPVYTAELYPTPIRNAGVGAGNFAGGAALILVPYLSFLVSRRRSHSIPITFSN